MKNKSTQEVCRVAYTDTLTYEACAQTILISCVIEMD